VLEAVQQVLRLKGGSSVHHQSCHSASAHCCRRQGVGAPSAPPSAFWFARFHRRRRLSAVRPGHHQPRPAITLAAVALNRRRASVIPPSEPGRSLRHHAPHHPGAVAATVVAAIGAASGLPPSVPPSLRPGRGCRHRGRRLRRLDVAQQHLEVVTCRFVSRVELERLAVLGRSLPSSCSSPRRLAEVCSEFSLSARLWRRGPSRG